MSDGGLKLIREPVLVRQLAADTLRQAIVTGVFAPGERLVEATLSREMGVSRPSIREAFAQLAAERLVTIRPNRGPAVSVIGLEDAKAIYEVRSLLEGEAAAQFAGRATSSDVNRMRQALGAFEAAIPAADIAVLLRSTSAFYDVITLGCGNPLIAEILHGINARVSFLRARSMSRPGRSIHSLAEMELILSAIASRHGDAAQEASRAHVAAAFEAVRLVFAQLDEAGETLAS